MRVNDYTEHHLYQNIGQVELLGGSHSFSDDGRVLTLYGHDVVPLYFMRGIAERIKKLGKVKIAIEKGEPGEEEMGRST